MFNFDSKFNQEIFATSCTVCISLSYVTVLSKHAALSARPKSINMWFIYNIFI